VQTVILKISANLGFNYVRNIMKSIGNILVSTQKTLGFTKGVLAARGVDLGNLELANIFGSEIKNHAQATYFKNGTLAISCLSSIVAQEIKLHETEIIANINQKLASKAVKRLRLES
jgi:hypothetical protein